MTWLPKAGLTVVAPPGPGTPLAPGRAPGGGAFPTPRVGDTVYVNAAGTATTVSTCGWPSDRGSSSHRTIGKTQRKKLMEHVNFR